MTVGRINFSIQWLTVLFPVLWVSGLHVNDLARVGAVVLLGFLIYFGKNLPAPGQDFGPGTVRSFIFFLAACSVFVFTEPLLSVYAGSHGIDFAIFTQVVDSIHRFGKPVTSLVSMDWMNFISHHFAPILYVPASLVMAGLPSFVAISLVHGLGVVAAGWLFYLLSRALKFSSLTSLMFTTLLFANPTVRHGLFYGVHDEIFALPFLMLAFLSWQTGRIVLTCIALLLAALCKESLSAVGIALIATIIIDDRFLGRRSQTLSRRDFGLLGAVAALLGLLFVGYFFLQPMFTGKSFDHINKLGSLSELTRWDILQGKIGFYIFLLLPLLCLPLWAFRSWHLFLPSVPLLGIIFVSRFSDMWSPLNYYGVVPSFLLYAGALVTIARSPRLKDSLKQPALVALLICIAFSWSSKKPLRTIINVLRLPTYSAEQLSLIPSEARVIASPAAALFLFRTKFIWRLGNAGVNPPENFDFVVRKINDLEEIDPPLMSLLEFCHRDTLWEIYCNRKSMLKLSNPR